MSGLNNSILTTKSENFSIRIIEVFRYLSTVIREYNHSRQLLRSGTSINEIINESISAQNEQELLDKLNNAIDAANETLYWINFLSNYGCLEKELSESLSEDVEEIGSLLTSAINTIQQNNSELLNSNF